MGEASASNEARFDRERIEADLHRRHGWARLLAPGKLSLSVIYSDPDIKDRNYQRIETLNVDIGDIEGSVKFVMGYENKPNWNVFTSLCVFRADLPRTKRPKGEDCIGVFGLIADCDTDKGRNNPIPVKATFEINSSPGNYHKAFVFDAPVSYEGAKPVARALQNATGTDGGSSDPVHLWRIDGTLNWPIWVKVHERGRSREPFPVRITTTNFDQRYGVDTLHLQLIHSQKPSDGAASPPRQEPRDAKSLFGSLPLGAQSLIRTPLPEGERSEATFSAICTMVLKGFCNDEIHSVAALYPKGPFERYATAKALDEDIRRARSKAHGRSPLRATGAPLLTYEEILNRVEELKGADAEGAAQIVTEAVAAEVSELRIAALLKRLAKVLGVTPTEAKKFWKDTEAAIKAADMPTPEELQRLEQEENERRIHEAKAERERLWTSCSALALDKALSDKMEDLVHRLGVVGEGAAIRAEYLAASSRLNRTRSISLLRRGAAAGGKNYLIDKVLVLIPADSAVRMSSGSPLSLVYYGGGDEDALKHKVLYIPEAAVLADRQTKVENPQTIMLRLLISEGRLDHHVVVTQGEGPPVTVHIKRNGPVAVIVTSARDNIEDELLTRLMICDADESIEQTNAVLQDVLSNEDRDGAPEEVAQWLDFQGWLETSGPYDVTIPYRRAILDAYVKRNAAVEEPNIQLRIRRDIHGFLTAIKTSAILYCAQRETNGQGRIVATLDDYENAYRAFGPGLASLYRYQPPETLVAVVRAVERMKAHGSADNMFNKDEVRVSISALMSELGISGRGIAASRLRAAVDAGYLQLTSFAKGTRASFYKIVNSSNDIVETAAYGVFPATSEVEACVPR
jgi:hypothetical protein